MDNMNNVNPDMNQNPVDQSGVSNAQVVQPVEQSVQQPVQQPVQNFNPAFETMNVGGPQPEGDKSKGIIILLILIVLALGCAVGYFVYDKVTNDTKTEEKEDKKDNKKDNKDSNDKEDKKDSDDKEDKDDKKESTGSSNTETLSCTISEKEEGMEISMTLNFMYDKKAKELSGIKVGYKMIVGEEMVAMFKEYGTDLCEESIFDDVEGKCQSEFGKDYIAASYEYSVDQISEIFDDSTLDKKATLQEIKESIEEEFKDETSEMVCTIK